MIFFLLALHGLFLGIPAQGGAQSANPAILADLQGNAKFVDENAILADYLSGADETGVIVLLRSSGKGNELASQSATAPVPNEFRQPGAPTFYNLRDRAVRKQLRATVTETVAAALDRLAGEGMRVTNRFSYQFGFAARVTPAALRRIVADPEVLTVEPVRILQPHLAQGIPLMNASTPRTTYDGTGLSIAICDTGIDTSHPRLGGGGSPIFNDKVIGGYDTGDGDADPRPNSLYGEAHGTACAGIAAGDTGTVGDYIGGVAPGARLYAIKISTGNTGSANSPDMIDGWEWALDHQDDDPANPIMIISTSFGGGKYSSTCDGISPSMTAAAANAAAAGITLFVSSGNDGYCDAMGWPACISHVNSVGAVYDANFGTYTPCIDASSCALTKTATGGCSSGYYATDNTSPDMVTSYSNSASFLTLFAPSNRAYTTDITGTGGYAAGDYATSFGGTSAACPYAAGAAAVLQSAARDRTGAYLTPAQVRQYLADNGNDITDSKPSGITRPRVNLSDAVNALPLNYPLTVNKNGTGSGTVTSSPSGITCGADCTEFYADNTVVTLTPATDSGSTFSSWSGDCTGTDPCSVTMNQARSVTAAFTLNTYTVTANAAGNGAGTVSSDVGGIDYTYPATSTETSTALNHGSSITLTATAGTGSTVSWTGCPATGGTPTAATCTFASLDANKTVTATFTLNTYTVTANAVGNGAGTVASDVGGINFTYPATNSATSSALNHGSAITLTATAGTGSTVSWTGCPANGGTPTAATCTFASVDANKTVAATFTLNTYTVTPVPGPNGSMSPATPQNVNYNETIAFTVTPDNGYRIDTVTGCSGSLAGALYTTGPITGDCDVIATFAPGGYTVTPSAGPNGSIFPSTPQVVNHGFTTSFTVTPDPSSHVDSVTGCGGSLVGDMYTTGLITGDCTVTASFAINTYALTVILTGKGEGSVTSEPAGIACNDDCTELFASGIPVTLTASPRSGSAFVGWSGACAGTDSTCALTVDQEKNVTAEFHSFPWPMFLPAITTKE
jgi:subtilisin family serine protease